MADGASAPARGRPDLPRLTTTCLTLLLLTICARAETASDRGSYLVNVVGACGNCHSPVDANGDRRGPAFSGGPALLSGAFEAFAPNITPDVDTGIGSWSEDQIVTALRDGRTPDGHVLRPPMPVPLYRALSDDDAHAIAAYLKTLPPVSHREAESTYKVPTPAGYGPPVGVVADPPRDAPAVYGAYLAKLAHCVQCHTPVGPDGRRDFARQLGAGGLSVEISWGTRTAANITPDPETGIGLWTDDQIVAALSRGVRPDGTTLSPIMPWPYWRTMKPEDLKAIVAWLRTLRPVAHAVDR